MVECMYSDLCEAAWNAAEYLQIMRDHGFTIPALEASLIYYDMTETGEPFVD